MLASPGSPRVKRLQARCQTDHYHLARKPAKVRAVHRSPACGYRDTVKSFGHNEIIRGGSRSRERRLVCTCKGRSEGRLSVQEMKAALESAGISTSDCFDYADLQKKYNEFSTSSAHNSQGSNYGENSRSAEDTTAKQDAASSSSSDSDRAGFGEFLDDLKRRFGSLPGQVWSKVKSEAASGALLNNLRLSILGFDARFQVSAKVRNLGLTIRGYLESFDDKVKLSRTIKERLPGLINKLQAFRRTPIGGIVFGIFGFWFIFSGFFFQVLSWAFPVYLLTNWIFPGTIQNYARGVSAQFAQEAQERVRRAQGGSPGFGNQDFGSPGTQGSSRSAYGDAGDSTIIDVDAKVVDEKK